MPFTSIAASSLLLLFCVTGLAQEITLPNTGYTVRMPGPSECRAESMDTVDGKQDMHICTYVDKASGVYYSLQFVPLPTDTRGRDAYAVLEGLKSEVAVMTSSEVVRESRFAVDGYPGLETLLRGQEGSSNSLIRFICTDRHLVVVTVAGIGSTVTSSPARSFLDSVRIRATALGK